MKQYRKLFFLGFICAAWPVSYAQAQDVSAGVPDSLLTIGYTVGPVSYTHLTLPTIA